MKFKIEDIAEAISVVSINFQGEQFDIMDDLFESGILDSISVVQLVAKLEEIFSISFDFEDLNRESFKNVMAIKSLLEKEYELQFQ